MPITRPSPTAVLADLSLQLGTVSHREEYLDAVASMLLEVLGGDLVGWNAIDAVTGQAEARMFPEPHAYTRLDETLGDVADDHPLIVSYLAERANGLGMPRRLSDVSDRQSLRATKAYTQILRPIRADHQLSIVTRSTPARRFHAWGITRTGGHDFSDEAVELAAALQPVLALLDRLCMPITSASPPADSPDADQAVANAGLTSREVDVLRLIAGGFTASAASRLLRISERTVRKHLENTYRKIGCHDRLLATAWAYEAKLVSPASRPAGIDARRRRAGTDLCSDEQ